MLINIDCKQGNNHYRNYFAFRFLVIKMHFTITDTKLALAHKAKDTLLNVDLDKNQTCNAFPIFIG